MRVVLKACQSKTIIYWQNLLGGKFMRTGQRTPIERLEIFPESPRKNSGVQALLRSNGIKTVEKLKEMTQLDLLRIKGLGRLKLNATIVALEAQGGSLAPIPS